MSTFSRKPRTPAAVVPLQSGASISPLNEAEQQSVGNRLAELSRDGVDPLDPVQLGAYYDQVYAQWSAADENDRPDATPLINRIGTGLGACVASRTGLEWAIATDEYGTDLALHGQPNDVLLYPPDAVSKRWYRGETGFIPGLVESLVGAANDLRGRR